MNGWLYLAFNVAILIANVVCGTGWYITRYTVRVIFMPFVDDVERTVEIYAYAQ